MKNNLVTLPTEKSLRQQYPAEWRAWRDAQRRCYDPNNKDYKHYGGRGITMCDEWRASFAAFMRDMKPRPAGCSLERIDVDLNYDKPNCKWATWAEQNVNRTNNHILEHDGKRLAASEWARLLGLGYDAILGRIWAGYPVDVVLDPHINLHKRCNQALRHSREGSQCQNVTAAA